MATGAGVHLGTEDDISGSKTATTNWFGSDLSPKTPEAATDKPVKIGIGISISAGAGVEVTWDGSNYSKLNDGTDLSADTLYTFAFWLKFGDTFNIRTVSGAATVEIDYCRIVEYPEEA